MPSEAVLVLAPTLMSDAVDDVRAGPEVNVLVNRGFDRVGCDDEDEEGAESESMSARLALRVSSRDEAIPIVQNR